MFIMIIPDVMKKGLFSAFLLLAVMFFAFEASAQSNSGGTQPMAAPSGGMTKAQLDSIRHPFARVPVEATPLDKSYPDSVEFNKAFEEFYPLVQPKESVMKRVTDQFIRLIPSYKARGVDSAAAYKALMKAVDTNHDHQFMYVEYRRIFSAEELKAYTQFLKTPTGKKVLESQMNIARASVEPSGYATQIVSRTIAPMAHVPDAPPHGMMPPHGMPMRPQGAQTPPEAAQPQVPQSKQ